MRRERLFSLSDVDGSCEIGPLSEDDLSGVCWRRRSAADDAHSGYQTVDTSIPDGREDNAESE